MSLSFKCAACGKAYQVKDEFAGRKVKCACGASFTVPKPATKSASGKPPNATSNPAPKPTASSKPTTPKKVSAPAAPAAASFLDEELENSEKTCPSCKTQVKHNVVLCIKCGYNFRERKKVESAVAATSAGLKCKKCGSSDTRRTSDGELEQFRDRKETAVTIGRPVICNKCGHMFEPPASFFNYVSSYGRGTVLLAAGAVVVAGVCFVAWNIAGAAMEVDDEGVSVGMSPRQMVRAIRSSYPMLGVLAAGLSLAGAGVWGVLRTLIVQMGFKGLLYDPDEIKW